MDEPLLKEIIHRRYPPLPVDPSVQIRGTNAHIDRQPLYKLTMTASDYPIHQLYISRLRCSIVAKPVIVIG